MIALVADRTLADLSANWWAAIAAWVGALGTIGLLWFAVRELKASTGQQERQIAHELAVLREESRPFMVADITFRSILVILTFTNIGRTPARNVKIRLDERLVSASQESEPAWQDSQVFKDGMPSVAPGRELRFYFDTFPARQESTLSPLIRGHFDYEDSFGTTFRDEPFVIDLSVYGPMLQNDKNLHDLVAQVEALNSTAKVWGMDGRGLRVNTVNHDRAANREIRPMHVSKALQARADDGWYGFVKYWIDSWRNRLGLTEW